MDVTDSKTLQRPRPVRRYASAVLIAVSCLHSGCQTWQKSHESAIAEFSDGDLEAARASLQKSQKAIGSEKHLLQLDQGILDLADGDLSLAESRFRTVRRELDHLEQKDLTEQTSSILTDSRAVAFSGREFERRMVLNMALLTSMIGDGHDAFAYSLQVAEATATRRLAIAGTAEKYAQGGNSEVAVFAEASDVDGTAVARIHHVSEATGKAHPSIAPSMVAPSPVDQTLALSSYLAAAVQSEQPSRSIETAKALSEIAYWNPAFRSATEENALSGGFGVQCKAGHGALHVIALVGRAPRWVSESAEPTSAALLIADRIISAAGKHTLPPTIASVKIAKPEPCLNVIPRGVLRCVVSASEASNDAVAVASFATLVDLNDVAQAWYNEHRDEEIAAVIARRVVKKGAIYVLKETQKVHRNSLIDLGVNAAGVAWEALEKPDTRSWRMLPARVDVAQTELPAGAWTATLQVSGSPRSNGLMTIPVQIVDGRNTYVLCMIPESEFAGQIVVGGAVRSSFAVQ